MGRTLTTISAVILAIVSLFAFAGAATAAALTYYVDSVSGSDANAGTSPSSAWRTIQKVNATSLSPGQSVLFKGGETFTGELDTNGSGTTASPIAYGSYGTGRAVLDAGRMSVWMASEHDVTLSNLVLDGGGRACVVDSASGTGIKRVTFDNLEVRNCTVGFNLNNGADADGTIQTTYIHDTTDSAIILTGASHTPNAGGWVVEDDTLTRVATADGDCGLGYGAHGIYSDSPGIQILRNDIGPFGCDGGQAISTRFRNALIQGNALHDGPVGVGYYNYDASEPAGGGTTVVRYNRIWNLCSSCSGGYGIDVSNDADNGALAGAENWRIYNNTITSSNARGSAIRFDASNATELTIENNIVSGWWGLGQLYIANTPTTLIVDHNGWAEGTSNGAGDITASPNLSPPPTFTPISGSPVIDAGTPNVPGATFTGDCTGQPLSYCGAAPDMGASETGVRPATTTTIATSPVSATAANNPLSLGASSTGTRNRAQWSSRSKTCTARARRRRAHGRARRRRPRHLQRCLQLDVPRKLRHR